MSMLEGIMSLWCPCQDFFRFSLLMRFFWEFFIVLTEESESCVHLMFHSVGVMKPFESVTGIMGYKNTLDLSFILKFLTSSV